MAVDDHAGIGFPVAGHAWWMRGRKERADFRALLYLLKGRQGEIWLPSYQRDLSLAALVAPAATTMDIETTGYTLYLVGQLNRKDIRIELKNGTVLYRRITGSTTVDANTERLSIDSALGVQVAPAQVRRISYMALSRLNSDSIDIMHVNAGNGLATASAQFRSLNHDV